MCVEGCGLWVVRWGVLALDVGTLDVEMLGRIGSHRADAISHRACREDAHHGGDLRHCIVQSRKEKARHRVPVGSPPSSADLVFRAFRGAASRTVMRRGGAPQGVDRRPRCPSTHPVCSRIGVRDKPSPGRGLEARPSRLGEAPSFFAKHDVHPQVSPLERGEQGPTGGRSSRGEG